MFWFDLVLGRLIDEHLDIPVHILYSINTFDHNFLFAANHDATRHFAVAVFRFLLNNEPQPHSLLLAINVRTCKLYVLIEDLVPLVISSACADCCHPLDNRRGLLDLDGLCSSH